MVSESVLVCAIGSCDSTVVILATRNTSRWVYLDYNTTPYSICPLPRFAETRPPSRVYLSPCRCRNSTQRGARDGRIHVSSRAPLDKVLHLRYNPSLLEYMCSINVGWGSHHEQCGECCLRRQPRTVACRSSRSFRPALGSAKWPLSAPQFCRTTGWFDSGMAGWCRFGDGFGNGSEHPRACPRSCYCDHFGRFGDGGDVSNGETN